MNLKLINYLLLFSFIYYITNSSEAWQTPLFPFDAPQNYSQSVVRRLNDLPPLLTIEVDPEHQTLIVVTKNGQILSLSFLTFSFKNSNGKVFRSRFFRRVN